MTMVIYGELPSEEYDMRMEPEMNNLININLELLNKDTSKMSRKEKLAYIRDLEFERLALRNHWSEDERKEKRLQFDEEKDRERKIFDDSIDMLIGRDKNLTAFEKKQAEKFLNDNPDIVAFFEW